MEKGRSDDTVIDKINSIAGFQTIAGCIDLFTGMPITSMFADVFSRLIDNKYKKIVQTNLTDIYNILEKQNKNIDNISHEQRSLIYETIVTVFKTYEEDKLPFLKNVIRNTIDLDYIEQHKASFIARIIRDISAAEIKFLIQGEFGGKSYSQICLYFNKDHHSKHTWDGETPTIFPVVLDFKSSIEVKDDILYVSSKSEEVNFLNGLVSLGLLIPSDINSNGQYYSYSPIVETIKELLKD